MHDVISQFERLRLIPVIAIDRTENAMPLADALVEAGARVALAGRNMAKLANAAAETKIRLA